MTAVAALLCVKAVLQKAGIHGKRSSYDHCGRHGNVFNRRQLVLAPDDVGWTRVFIVLAMLAMRKHASMYTSVHACLHVVQLVLMHAPLLHCSTWSSPCYVLHHFFATTCISMLLCTPGIHRVRGVLRCESTALTVQQTSSFADALYMCVRLQWLVTASRHR
eukprot:3342423-Amphidinium_carterae.1